MFITGEKLSSDEAADEPFKNLFQNKIEQMQLCSDFSLQYRQMRASENYFLKVIYKVEISAPGKINEQGARYIYALL